MSSRLEGRGAQVRARVRIPSLYGSAGPGAPGNLHFWQADSLASSNGLSGDEFSQSTEK